MSTLPGINLVWHSIRPQGGMDRHVLDLISGFSSRGIPMRVIARTVSWPGEKPDNVEFVVLPDRTPFQRFNNNRFEHKAYEHIRTGWPVIGISRIFNLSIITSAKRTFHNYFSPCFISASAT